jgi:hypothetical protein
LQLVQATAQSVLITPQTQGYVRRQGFEGVLAIHGKRFVIRPG